MSGQLFDRYFAYVQDTEPPLVFHRWSILSALGALLGRQYYLPFGDFNVMPNMYTMLIGDPGTRKSTAIKLSQKVLASTGYDTFSAERTSKEKFLIDLEGVEGDDPGVVTANKNQMMTNLFGTDAPGGDPKEMFVVADEFNVFVGSGNIEFLSLLGSLWDWDSPEKLFKQRLKTSRSVSIYQPTINILAGNTHAGFADAFPPQAIGQGFLSRLILVYGEPSGKKITFPKKPSDEVRLAVINTLLDIKSKVVGAATMSDQAQGMLTSIYETFTELEDARFKHYCTRRFTHLLKLCMLTAAANMRTNIGASDVLFANSLLSFTEHRMPNALGEYGKARNSEMAARVIALLSDATGPLELTDIWKRTAAHTDLDKPEELLKIMTGLMQAGKVQYVNRGPSNNKTGYLVLRSRLKATQVYVDYDLLQEAKGG